MDADVRRMLADLGNVRRDEVAAPEDVGYRHEYRPPNVGAREERMIRLLADDHRANAGDNESDPTRAATLRGWNDVATFGGDDIAEQLENRFSGQGHRAALARTIQKYDDYCEDDYHRPSRRQGRREDHPGEDRRLRPQERQSAQAPALSASTPTGARRRAPSPRAAGTTRYLRDHPVQHPQQPPFMPPPSATPSTLFGPPLTAAASRTSPAAASGRAPAQAVPPHTASQLAATRRKADAQAQAEAAAASVTPVPTGATSAASNVLSPVAAPRARALPTASTGTHARGPRTAATTASAATDSALQCPRTALDAVWQKLDGIKPWTPSPASVSPSIPAATQAVVPTPVPGGVTQQAADTFVSSTPSATRRLPSSPPLYDDLPTETWKITSKVAFRKAIQLALADAAEANNTGSAFWPENSETRHLFDIARNKIAMDAIRLMEFPDAPVANSYFNMHQDRAWIRDHALDAVNGRLAEASSDPMLAELVQVAKILLGVEPGQSVARGPTQPAQPAATNASAPHDSMSLPAGPPTPPASHGSSRVGSVDGANMAAVTSPPVVNRGMLNATFYDFDGVFRELFQAPINAPVQANVTVSARDPGYDPTNPAALGGMIESFARRMQARQQLGLRLNENGEWVD